MPGDGGYWYNQQNKALMADQQAAEKAAAKKAADAQAAAASVLTPEQRQANIAQDLALSQTRGARPSGLDSQFYQPAYQSQYNNYANPLTAGSVANYGTTQGPSAGYMAAMAPGGQGLDNYYKSLQQFGAQQSSQPYGMDYATFNPARKAMGASQSDLMAAYSYNPMQSPFNYQQPTAQPQINQQAGQFSTVGGNTLTPELARTLMQRSMTGSGVPTSEFQKFGGYDTVKALYDKSGGDYSGQGNPYPQQQFNPFTNQYQTPFSYQQPQYQQQQMQTPFSYQQPMQQPAAQMQTPFSYSAPMQLPQYVYDTIRDVNSYQSQPVQAYQSPRAMPATSSGPSQAIVGRSSQMRGTPNVMRRAEGGITSLLDNDE